MVDISNWYRVIGLYTALHVILFCVEWYRYKHGTLSWYGFKEHRMYFLSHALIYLDILIILAAICMWALWPLLDNFEVNDNYYDTLPGSMSKDELIELYQK